MMSPVSAAATTATSVATRWSFPRPHAHLHRLHRRCDRNGNVSCSRRHNNQRGYYTASFSGAGHLLPYHLGVAKVLKQIEEQRWHHQKYVEASRSDHGGEDRSDTTGNDDEFNTTTAPKMTASTKTKLSNIRAVSGSSSGAIAAVCFALFSSDVLDRYTDRFLEERGRALTILQDLLHEEYQHAAGANQHDERRQFPSPPIVSIATAKCSDGSLHLHNFSFNDDDRDDLHKQLGGADGGGGDHHHDVTRRLYSSSLSNNPSVDEIMRAVQASCTIPRSFHPVDMFSSSSLSSSSSSSLYYPDNEGVDINGVSYVDGGIVAPLPPTALDWSPSCEGLIRVSPISGGNGRMDVRSKDDGDDNDMMSSIHDDTASRRNQQQQQRLQPQEQHSGRNSARIISIRPDDESFALPLPKSMTTTRCRSFDIRPSLQNLRALVVSTGLVHPPVLKDWYRRGVDDATMKSVSSV